MSPPLDVDGTRVALGKVEQPLHHGRGAQIKAVAELVYLEGRHDTMGKGDQHLHHGAAICPAGGMVERGTIAGGV